MGATLGLNAKLYRNTATWATPTWVEITNVKDLTLNLEKATADVTTRAANGWRQFVSTLKEGGVEMQMVWDTADAGFTAVKDAWFNNTTIELAVMDGDITVAGKEGLHADFEVANFNRGEPLEDALTSDVAFKVAYSVNAPEWLVVA